MNNAISEPERACVTRQFLNDEHKELLDAHLAARQGRPEQEAQALQATLRDLMRACGKIARARMRVSEGDARRSASYAVMKAERATGSGAAQPR
jgi:hypothetical protein